MRLSCNGCRVLRKGCSEDCIIRPCLEWINSPESQANATVFLAKFYGRAGLINLINAAPQHLRPAIFRSLLYEACGRIVNPIYGSVGLLWSGSWQLCQASVEAILKGEPITPITSEAAANGEGPPLKPYDIRHVSKDHNSESQRVKTRSSQHTVKTQSRFKRIVKPKSISRIGSNSVEEANWSKSHESSLSEPCKESESGVSVEASILFHDEPESEPMEREGTKESGSNEVCLELRLGFEPDSRAYHMVPLKKRRIEFGLEFKFPA